MCLVWTSVSCAARQFTAASQSRFFAKHLQDFVVMKLKIGQWLLIELKYSMPGSVVPLAMFEIYDISWANSTSDIKWLQIDMSGSFKGRF